MKFYVFLFSILLWNITSARAQHFLDGTWEGNYTRTFLMTHPRKVVVNLEVTNDTIVTGTSHLYYKSNSNFEHYTVHGIYHPKDSTIIFSEDSTIAVNLGFGATNCLGDYTMKLNASDTLLSFKGKWQDNSSSFLGCPTTGVWLNKPILNKKPPVKKDKNLQRIAQVQKLIEIDRSEMDSIKIEIRDNGQIDGDVVSVYFNDSIVISKQKLIAAPLTFYINIPPNTSICNVKMVAESMGSMPPCTALMNVFTKLKAYEVNLESSMSNNSAVQFFLKE